MGKIIEKVAKVLFYVEDEYEMRLGDLLDILYDLEDCDGVSSKIYIPFQDIADYLVKQGVAIERPHGGYRLLDESKRLAMLDRLENMKLNLEV